MRFEDTRTYKQGALDRQRGVVRARIDGELDTGPYLTAGARLVTGDKDDPRSPDVTLSDFSDKLSASFDLLYLRLAHSNAALSFGRFRNPFLTSELVWDADVNPQGAAFNYASPFFGSVSTGASGMFFTQKEQAAGADSRMWAAQIPITLKKRDWSATIAGGLFDHHIPSLVGTQASDVRGNKIATGGATFEFGFRLIDAIAKVQCSVLGERAPISFLGHIVGNTKAIDQAKDGANFELGAGSVAQVHGIRGRVAYAFAEREAVLGLYSNDNIPLATNYRLWTAAVDFVAWERSLANVTMYLYRTDTGPSDWSSRIRLNLLVNF